MELIKQIKAILKARKQRRKRHSPQHSAYGRTYRLMVMLVLNWLPYARTGGVVVAAIFTK